MKRPIIKTEIKTSTSHFKETSSDRNNETDHSISPKNRKRVAEKSSSKAIIAGHSQRSMLIKKSTSNVGSSNPEIKVDPATANVHSNLFVRPTKLINIIAHKVEP